MSYWAVARLEPHREQLALRCLGLAGYETYFPRLRERRISYGRKIEVRPPLFPGYCFLTVEAQWYAARWSLGVIGLIMDGIRPARVADQIIDDLRKHERNGLIELTQRSGLKPGDQVRILQPACELTSGCWCCWRCSAASGGWSWRRATSRRRGRADARPVAGQHCRGAGNPRRRFRFGGKSVAVLSGLGHPRDTELGCR
jgi:hypothetical protein